MMRMKNTILQTTPRIAGAAAIVLSTVAFVQVQGWAQPVANVASTEPAGDSYAPTTASHRRPKHCFIVATAFGSAATTSCCAIKPDQSDLFATPGQL